MIKIKSIELLKTFAEGLGPGRAHIKKRTFSILHLPLTLSAGT
jgi:hypothetical protein